MPEITRKILDRHIDTEKAVEYLKKQQRPDGSFYGLRPNPIISMHCLKILEKIGAKPKHENTFRWTSSLQTGKRGFGEVTGMNSWDYTTYHGSEMHKSLGLKPRFEKEFKEFVLGHQNKDGSFSNNFEEEPSLNSTLNWTLAAINLGFGKEMNKTVVDYLKKALLNRLDYPTMHKVIYAISQIDCVPITISDEMMEELRREQELDLHKVFFCCKMLSLFGEAIPEHYKKYFSKSYEQQQFRNPEATSMILELLQLFEMRVNKEEFLNYALTKEIPCGGFYEKDETNILNIYSCAQSMRMLNEDIGCTDRALEWLSKQASNNFYGVLKHVSWGWRTLIMAGKKEPDKRLTDYLDASMENVNPYDAFYITNTCVLINHTPKNYRSASAKLLRYQNSDGGFAIPIGGKSQMYETYRTAQSLHNLHIIHEKNRAIHMHLLEKAREKIINWVKSCENKEGGFSWVPDEQSYTQPTYQALHTLHILNEKPDFSHRHTDYLRQIQNDDGGFNGGEKGTPSMAVFSYYALASLLILHEKEIGQEISDFLGV
jgi:prenyltransferase beta subunit